MDCSPPGSSVYGIFQTRVMEWVVNALSDFTVHGVAKSRTRLSDFHFQGAEIKEAGKGGKTNKAPYYR